MWRATTRPVSPTRPPNAGHSTSGGASRRAVRQCDYARPRKPLGVQGVGNFRHPTHSPVSWSVFAIRAAISVGGLKSNSGALTI